MHLLQKGNRARTVEPTAANKTSSRSHALLSVTVRQTKPLQHPHHLRSRVKHGKLFMIDLAGSERASQTKVERNVLDVSYHVSQYRTIISELRDEIARLKAKMTEERPRSGDTSTDKGEKLKLLRDQIVSTFREQMRLRRRLMDYDGHLLRLSSEADRQHALISLWESRNNKLYKNNHTANKWHGRRPNTDPEMDVDQDIMDVDIDAPLQMAWSELSFIEKEQERYAELRASTERELEGCRQRGVALENELPSQISSEEERELLALMCRVHELEVEKMALQSERLIKQHELRRRDLVILRYDRQRQLCEEIITRQRQLMEEGCVTLPPDLQELYRIYQQEIHAATYTDSSPSFQSGVPFSSYTRDKDKLPPIQSSAEPLFHRSLRYNADPEMDRAGSDISMRTPNSSAGSDYIPSPLPPITGTDGIGRMGQLSSLPPPAVLFPPISGPNKGLHDASRYLSRYV
ncbi:hypothetical protein C0J52_09468 [Blattella germanica]|nr:hypothetical protein C0J52_09468 [Blattella germanica]